MENMEQLLTNLPNLRHLELRARGHTDIVDAYRWQMVTNRLITFNFMFTVSSDLCSQHLDSFRSPFWINEKHWYVALVNRSLFSVPHFAQTCADEQFKPNTLSTLPDSIIFNDCITELTLSQPIMDSCQHFPRVHTLSLSYSIPLSSIEKLADLSRIQQLNLSSTSQHSGIMLLINEIPNLCQISITNQIKCFLEEVQYKPLSNIRKLEIGSHHLDDIDDHDNYSIDQLCCVFPCIKHLHITHRCSTTQILNFIKGFHQLSTASFRYAKWSVRERDREKDIIEVQSTLDENRRSQTVDYTYRFDQSSVYIWL